MLNEDTIGITGNEEAVEATPVPEQKGEVSTTQEYSQIGRTVLASGNGSEVTLRYVLLRREDNYDPPIDTES